MRTARTILLFCIAGLVASIQAAEPDLKAGDCWKYRTRPNEPDSFLLIRKVQAIPGLGEIASVSVYRLKLKNPDAPGGVTEEIPHLPITTSALRSSLVELTHANLPGAEWMDGYQLWHDAALKGKATAFTHPVAETLDRIEAELNENRPTTGK